MAESENGDTPVERATFELFLRQCDEEQQRLRAEIQAAKNRMALADAGPARADQSDEAELGALVMAAHEQLARLEEEHREMIQAIRDRSLVEASRVLDEARARAEEVRARAARMLIDPSEPER